MKRLIMRAKSIKEDVKNVLCNVTKNHPNLIGKGEAEMTNAEKFKEVFGYDIDIDAMTICPFKNVETVCLDRDVPCRECLDDYWYNKEYQGEPTIPLSVIEKIKAEINAKRNRTITLFKSDGVTKQELTFSDTAYVDVLEIIDKAVKESNT